MGSTGQNIAMKDKLKIIYNNINYTFKNNKILKQALTHRSLTKNNNERLEFLGDSILNFTITELLYNKFPKESEGNLSIMKNSLIKGKRLTEIAKKYIFWKRGTTIWRNKERKINGRCIRGNYRGYIYR